jgi:hypothetical protein
VWRGRLPPGACGADQLGRIGGTIGLSCSRGADHDHFMRRRRKVDPWQADDSELAYALNELSWYAGRRGRARILDRLLALTQLITASAAALLAAFSAEAVVTSVVAFVALVAGGINQMGRPREMWIDSAVAWAELRRAINEYRLLPEDQRSLDAKRRLVRTVDRIGAEHLTKWADRMKAPTDTASRAEQSVESRSGNSASQPDP